MSAPRVKGRGQLWRFLNSVRRAYRDQLGGVHANSLTRCRISALRAYANRQEARHAA